jgi:hypothetical protein
VVSFLALTALLTTFFILKSFANSKEVIILFLLVYFPLFYVDSTMNAIRYGLSFSLSALAIDSMYKNRKINFIVLSLFAVSIQISSFLIVFAFLIGRLNWRLILFFVICIVTFHSQIETFVFPYLLDKSDAYKVSYSPNKYSGLFPLIVFLILYLMFLYRSKNKFTLVFQVLLFCELISYYFTTITWAGTRFQMLFLFALILAIKNNYSLIEDKFKFTRGLFFVSVPLFFFFLRSIIYVDKNIDSRYLPYEFFWH